jgi:hypothetical protein
MRASLIQILLLVRSEQQLMEQMLYNLLFRWFVGFGVDDPAWPPTVFAKNRYRLLTTEMSRKFPAAILAHRDVAPLVSDEHFSVDGTLIKAWASMKGFQPKPQDTPPDGGASGDPPAAAPDCSADQPAPQDPQTAEQADPQPAVQAAPESAPMPKPAHRDRNAEVDFRAASGGRTPPTPRPPTPIPYAAQKVCAAPPPTAEQSGTRATPCPSSGERRSMSPSAGPRPWVVRRRPSCAASTVSVPGSLSPWWPTTSHGCRSC